MHKILNVFSPQKSVLPPHRAFDISIEIKAGCDAPFGGLYNLALNEQVELKAYLNDLLMKGFIRPSKSAAAAPIFFVKVPGKKNRPCVDYRGLNKVTKRDSYPIPVMSWLLNQLKGCKFFAKIDLKAAFNLLRLAEGDEWKTAFRTPWGLFEYLVMPFGLANAPACFQRFIQWVLREYLDIFCFVYIDDILIFSKTDDEHLDHVDNILAALSEHNLTASLEKCSFFQTTVTFLGFIISTTGISMDPEKLKKISEWPLPGSLKSLQRFLGFSNFYRRFIKNFSGVAGPLNALTANGVDTVKGLETREAKYSFNLLKKLFSSEPFLIHFDFSLPRVIHVDSPGYAYSGILSQKNAKGELKPVAYFSRKLNESERKWQVHDQELGAIIACFEEWRAWLIGCQETISVFSDHANLRYFMKAQSLTAKQAIWASYLSEFNFEILHIPGKSNPADPASRRSDYTGKENLTNRVVLLGHREGGDVQVQAITMRQLKISRINNPFASFMPAEKYILNSLRACYDTDEFLQGRIPIALTYHDHQWWWRDKLYVPRSMRQMILKQVHKAPAAGHWGVMKTLELLTRTFDWPNLRTDVLRFCSSCKSCQAVKVDHRAPQGTLMPIPIPDRPWSKIGVDFIVKLPLSKGFDSIMVVVDHFSKTAHFIPANETWKADQLAEAFIDQVFRLHGLPEKIVSDRGTTFMSHFWTSVLRQLKITPTPSTAFHPQTDGQVERTNALLEDYLRHYVSLEQTDWACWLALAEFSYNNTPLASTRCSPFFATNGFHPRFNYLVASSGIPAADKFVAHLQKIQDQLMENLIQAKEAQSRFYNKGRRVDIVYTPGDYVWLSRKHIKTRRQNSKLDVRRLGPFRVKRMIGKNAVELELTPAYSRLHPVFNVSLLMPYLPSDTSPPPQILDPVKDFPQNFVDWASTAFILAYRCLQPGVHEYLIRGQDPSALNDEWRLLTMLSPDLDPFLKQFHLSTPSRGSGPSDVIWQQRSL